MNSNDNLFPTNVSNIIKDFSNLVKNFSVKENDWETQKKEYERRISELEGEIKAHENINIDLLKRIRMLEYALNQERQKNSTIGNNNNQIQIQQNPQDNSLLFELSQQNYLKDDDLKFLKEKPGKQNLFSVLQSIGIDENLAKNLFDDFELNRTELEEMIKRNLDEKLSKIGNDNDNLDELNNKNQKDNNEIIDTKIKEKQFMYSLNKCYELKSHFDEVRQLTFLSEMNSLISVSEDCLIKVWSLNNIFYNSQNNDIEPYLTLRGHTGPLYCTESGKGDTNIVYTGGNEGLIQIWNIPKPDEIPSYGDSDSLFHFNVGFFQKKEEGEIIWQLKHHPSENLLVSLSSDATLNLWHTKTAEEYIKAFMSDNYYDNWFAASAKKKAISNANGEYAIPSTCEFICTDNNKLLVGFNDATMSIFDFGKENFSSNYNFLNEKTSYLTNRILYQPNCLVCCSSIPVIYGGFEDNTIKLIDLRNKGNFISNVINAHSDAVTSVNLLDDIYLISVSHDTTIKMWDTRRLNEPVITTVGSEKKWDEAMWDSLLIKSEMMLCVACADCTIKLFKL